MERLILISLHSGIESIDSNYNSVGGQIAEYKEGNDKKAIRIGCNRNLPCQVLRGQVCSAENYDQNDGEQLTFDSGVACGKTPEGIKVTDKLS